MAIFKITFVFSGQTFGWTESYYLDGSGTPQTIMLGARTVATARVQMMSGSASIEYIRVASVGVSPRQSLLAAPRTVRGTPEALPGVFDAAMDYSATSIMLRCSNVNFTRQKIIFSRGQPDYIVDNNGNYRPTAAFTSALTGFNNALVAAQYGWYGLGVKTVQPINSILGQANDQVNFTYVLPLFRPQDVGQVVQIRNAGITGSRNLNGVIPVRVLSVTSCQSIRRIPFFPWTGAGTSTFAPKGVVAIGFVAPERVVARKAGGPLYQSRGRARNRVLG